MEMLLAEDGLLSVTSADLQSFFHRMEIAKDGLGGLCFQVEGI